MDPNSLKTMAAAAAAGGDKVYVEDVFSTYVYNGNNTTGRDIVNGIDLAGEGGLVWVKKRSATENHVLIDTERGANKFLMSDNNSAETTSGGPVTAFNSDGFEVDNNGYVNGNSSDYVSWSFRKQPGFFDVVTYTGTGGSGQTVSHSLGSVPGMIIVKQTSAAGESWHVQHRYNTAKKLKLDTNAGESSGEDGFDNTAPTSSVFTVRYNGTNKEDASYVAYLFAHDAQQFGENGNESIIKCGSYTGSTTIDLGWEPQWVLVKRSDNTSNWGMFDTMRNFAEINTTNNGEQIEANSTSTAGSSQFGIGPTSTGLVTDGGSYGNDDYIYVAIRRGPMKTPEAGTEVFYSVVSNTPRNANLRPEKVDMYWFSKRSAWGENVQVSDRVRGFQSKNSLTNDGQATPWLKTAGTGVEAGSSGAIGQENWHAGGPFVTAASVHAGTDFLNMAFKRAPGFFDIVAYTGTGSARTLDHNLGVIPELVMIKAREGNYSWSVYVSSLSSPRTKKLHLNNDDAVGTPGAGTYWGNSDFTSTQISLGSYTETNQNTKGMIAYLFATIDGVSKVGNYTGTGASSTQNIDCGFTGGTRFALIKRSDSPGGNWYLWDSARGIVSGNDPYIKINTTAAEITNEDHIDPHNDGFIVTGDVNTTDGEYIFLAIA